MNPDVDLDDPEVASTILYYDADYPSPDDPRYPENFDDKTMSQGVAHDVERYKEIIAQTGDPVLEFCCGTGRVAIPLARQGYRVVGVDISSALLGQFRDKLDREEAATRDNLTLIEHDVCDLELEAGKFAVIVCAFNSLLCIPSFAAQRRALASAARHLRPGGELVLDCVNPLQIDIAGDPVPKPFFTRKNPHTGETYTRFAIRGPVDDEQVQRLYGWYDEVAGDGAVTRRHYSMHWRPIYRYELELMLNEAGFEILSIEGGHRGEPFTTASPHMFVRATKTL